MEQSVLHLSFVQILIAFGFILLVLFILRKRGIPQEKVVIINTLRMSLQLLIAGYILVFILKNPSLIMTLFIFLVMESFAILTIIKRSLPTSKELKKSIAIAIFVGSSIPLFYFILAVVQVKPWYNPQYFIPLGGMIIGNSMSSVALAVKRLKEGFIDNKHMVEGALMLGATPEQASKQIIDSAFENAIMPTLISMASMGIVVLPGMMSGQILSGTVPTTAIAYQIAIMLGILGSVSLSVILILKLGTKSFFNNKAQLI